MPDAMPSQRGAGQGGFGVGIRAATRYLPERILDNAELERMMDTSDEWIVQRTGVRERHIASEHETARTMATGALKRALRAASLEPSSLDLLIIGTVGMDMACPSAACQVLGDLAADPEFGRSTAAAMDLSAACCGFVYGLNIAHDLIRTGGYRTAAVIGAEKLSDTQQYNTAGRSTSIIFGDGAACALLARDDDPAKGCIAQTMHADGSRWEDLYIPRAEGRDFPGGARAPGDDLPLGLMRMNGRAVFRFAVSTFQDLIQETLDRASVGAEDVDLFVCHQSNVRIIEAARERFGIPAEKMPVNIDRYGNTSAASIPILLSELSDEGRVRAGSLVMFVAFGAGLTWSSSLWRV